MPWNRNLKVQQKERFSSSHETLLLPAAATQISICFPGPRVDQQACVISLDRGYNGDIVLSGKREVFIQRPALGRHSSKGLWGSPCTKEFGSRALSQEEAPWVGLHVRSGRQWGWETQRHCSQNTSLQSHFPLQIDKQINNPRG